MGHDRTGGMDLRWHTAGVDPGCDRLQTGDMAASLVSLVLETSNIDILYIYYNYYPYLLI